jgi:hypothetical protein
MHQTMSDAARSLADSSTIYHRYQRYVIASSVSQPTRLFRQSAARHRRDRIARVSVLLYSANNVTRT